MGKSIHEAGERPPVATKAGRGNDQSNDGERGNRGEIPVSMWTPGGDAVHLMGAETGERWRGRAAARADGGRHDTVR